VVVVAVVMVVVVVVVVNRDAPCNIDSNYLRAGCTSSSNYIQIKMWWWWWK
jgi:hypothetical protein